MKFPRDGREGGLQPKIFNATNLDIFWKQHNYSCCKKGDWVYIYVLKVQDHLEADNVKRVHRELNKISIMLQVSFGTCVSWHRHKYKELLKTLCCITMPFNNMQTLKFKTIMKD